MTRTHVKRLYKLIDFMLKLPPEATEHFDMTFWYNHSGEDSHKVDYSNIKKKDLMTCGTTACALGWAGTIPEFKRAGLRLVWTQRGAGNFVSGQSFFGLSDTEAKALFAFSSADARTPKEWAKGAKKMLENWGYLRP